MLGVLIGEQANDTAFCGQLFGHNSNFGPYRVSTLSTLAYVDGDAITRCDVHLCRIQDLTPLLRNVLSEPGGVVGFLDLPGGEGKCHRGGGDFIGGE